MSRRPATLLCALACCAALAASGCGDDPQEAASPLDEALGYLPADAPLAVAVKTDPESTQLQAVDSILNRFPFADQVKGELKAMLEESATVDFDADVRPLLGNDAVVGIAEPEELTAPDSSPIVALKTLDAARLRATIEGNAEVTEIGETEGASLYEHESGKVAAVAGDVVVLGGSREQVESALAQRARDDRLTEEQFVASLDGLSDDALLRARADTQPILEATEHDGRDLSTLPWVASLGTLGAVASADGDGLAMDFSVATDPAGLTEEDLPIAPGPEAPPVVASEDDVGVGVRDPAHLLEFGQRALAAKDSELSSELRGLEGRLGRRLGVDLEEDVLAELSGNASLSIGLLDGSFGVRSELGDPERFSNTLDRLARRLPSVADELGLDRLGVARPRRREGFYAVSADGERLLFGVVDDVFVLASDPERASELATRSPETLSGARGSITLSADAQALASQLAQKYIGGFGGLGAGFFTGPVGGMTGSLEAEPERLRGSLRLGIE